MRFVSMHAGCQRFAGSRSMSTHSAVIVKTIGSLVPPGVVTVMLRSPRLVSGARVKVTVICVELTTRTLLVVMPDGEALTVAPVAKLVPVRVTVPLAPNGPPLDGEIPVRVGGGSVTVKMTAVLVPPVVVTVTLRAVASPSRRWSGWR